jgi:hypothetical protein
MELYEHQLPPKKTSSPLFPMIRKLLQTRNSAGAEDRPTAPMH